MPAEPIPNGKLVLGRQERESVILDIGNISVKVTVTEIRGNAVRLGFDAPMCVNITREELKAAVAERVKEPEPRKPLTDAEAEAMVRTVCDAVSGTLPSAKAKALDDETEIALAVGRVVEALHRDGECWVRAAGFAPKRLEAAVVAKLKTDPQFVITIKTPWGGTPQPHAAMVVDPEVVAPSALTVRKRRGKKLPTDGQEVSKCG